MGATPQSRANAASDRSRLRAVAGGDEELPGGYGSAPDDAWQLRLDDLGLPVDDASFVSCRSSSTSVAR